MDKKQKPVSRRLSQSPAQGPSPQPLRNTVSEIDQEILRLLVRRTNLLEKMRVKGRLPIQDERFLREAWQNDVARVSRDPELSGRFFALMQQIAFLPKPVGPEKVDASLPGSQRRQAFNLAPPNLPVHLEMTAPFSGRQTCAWLYLAAAAGQPLYLAPCLQNDPLVDFVQGLAQIGAAVTREDEAIVARAAPPLPCPDKVIFTGSDEFALYLFIAHYIGRHSRVKFTGDSAMQLADLSSLRKFLPSMGARMVNIVPRSDGLPIRLESSGILPSGIAPADEIPASFVEALLLAAPFYETPFAVDLAAQSLAESILAHIRPLYDAAGVVYSLQGATLSVEPSSLVIPARPALNMDAELACFLLSFAAALGGAVKLKGQWADWPENKALTHICLANGFKFDSSGIEARFEAPIKKFAMEQVDLGVDWQIALVSALAACAALNGGDASLPDTVSSNADAADFLRICGIEVSDTGSLSLGERKEGLAWNAPTAAWAFALALAACDRKGKAGWPLGNPGIVMDIWPQFWAYYNSLPDPGPKKQEETKPPTRRPRRRILTEAIAVPPEIKEDDWR